MRCWNTPCPYAGEQTSHTAIIAPTSHYTSFVLNYKEKTVLGLVCHSPCREIPCTASCLLGGEAHGEPGIVPLPTGRTPAKREEL